MANVCGRYVVYIPGGNDTALVEGINYTPEQRRMINDIIMADNPNVEQVGFVANTQEPELKMAGGEFCGNATRSTAHYYLHGEPGELAITINGKKIHAGVYENGDAWCEIPLIDDRANMLSKIDDGIYKVEMDGMTTLVVLEEKASMYLANKENIKAEAVKFIEKYQLQDREAVGVMFLEQDDGQLKINPIVWVNKIDTLFYETACGSGTTATAIVKSFIEGMDGDYKILQPSGYTITAQVRYNGNVVDSVRISGVADTDGVEKSFQISE